MSSERREIKNITSYRSFLIGLLGHVDCGKTAVARELTEIVSTSGLDAHPQSKERGITIDLGFTSFVQENILITLVDAPGHADLIRSVVASGRIIDGAIIVIDGKEGIQVQTAEHMVILELLNITNVLFVINKIDVSSSGQVDKIEQQIRNLLKLTKFAENSPILRVSAKNGEGIKTLREKMISFIKAIPISSISPDFFVYPIDHHFHKKGIGVVVTGTTQGSTSVGENLTVIPHLVQVKIKNAQVYHQNVKEVPHGFRAGLVLSGIDGKQLQRGDILTNTPSRYKKIELVETDYFITHHFQNPIRFGSQINITHGMNTTIGRIFPFYLDENMHKMLVKEVDNNILTRWEREGVRYGTLLWFQQPQFVDTNEILILSNLDLPPSSLRFFGSAKIISILETDSNPEMFHVKIKEGRIKNPNYSSNSVLIEGLAQSKEGAKTLLNKILEPPFGKITSVFGGKGVVVAEKPIKHDCLVGDIVRLKMFRSVKISKSKSYN